MNKPLDISSIHDSIVELRGQRVLIDSDIAKIYGVATRDVNKAVANNPNKFPEGYILELNKSEKTELVENFHRFSKLKHSSVMPKAFPEKGLYMLATILKSPQATEATFTIIEPRRHGMARGSLPFRQPVGRHERARGRQTFAKIRELSRTITTLSATKEEAAQKPLLQRSGELVSELFEDELHTSDTETSIELNFAVLKFKHVIKRGK
jgi:hypothetical protein